MKQQHAVIILFALIVLSGLTSLGSYRATKRVITDDMNRALALTMEEQQSDVINEDTIRTFNSHLQIAALRGKATLAVDAHGQQFKAYAHCSEATIFSLSDQRPTMVMWMLTLIWAVIHFTSISPMATHRNSSFQRPTPNTKNLSPKTIQYGGMNYAESEGNFYDAQGQRIRLTPMQRQLMEMFFRADNHVLTKAEICDALWPKKDDASDTLYTLIRRLKPVVEQHSNLKIESDRGRAYELRIGSPSNLPQGEAI
ncbi:MAG: helix-turn-helix domain-containing protein [Prevotella sp.]|nr:helix-turn-helix domain-containing protein [Prevotella sp.]